MGNDLYWQETPKEIEEEYNSLYYSTWHFLSEIWGLKDSNDLAGTILTKDAIKQLETILVTAKASHNKELAEDMHGLINAINRLGSITLIVRG